MSVVTLPIAEYTPDLPAIGGGSRTVQNVIPRTPLSYGPFPNMAVFSNALAKRCQGSAAYINPDGTIAVFAGDANDLYTLTGSSPSWVNASKSAAAYSTTSDSQWGFALYGTQVIAANLSDAIQTFTLGTSTKFADLAAAAPKAKFAATVKTWLMVAHTNDGTFGFQPQRVWWAANNDATNWPTPGTAAAAQYQSDFVDLFGEGGFIQGIVGNLGTADGAVFQEHSVWRVVYEGPPGNFGFYPAEGVRGTPAPYSIVQLGNLVYYLGEDGFYVFDGTSSLPIGVNKVDKTFFAQLDQSSFSRVVGVADPINKIVMWAYPGTSSVNGTPNSILIYNWDLKRWSFVTGLTIETLVRVLSFGYTLDQLYTILGYTIDGLPFNLDSRAWTGGRLLLAAFDTNHKLNYFNGANLAPTVDTAEVQPFPGKTASISNTRPLVDGGTPSVAIGYRNRLVDSSTYTTPVAINAIGACPQRANGRYLKGEITLPAASSFTHIQGIEVEGMPGGSR